MQVVNISQKAFLKSLKDAGIIILQSTLHTLQQNGRADALCEQ